MSVRRHTLRFEDENEDELRKVGDAKERRVDPQIIVELPLDRGGLTCPAFPLAAQALPALA